MAKDQKVYMPLVIGDWLKGTLGMKAEVRGVYISLLLYQWDNGFIPSDLETLSLIDQEVGKVWVMLKDKFVELSPGKLHNVKNDEVKAFWSKQRKNGITGGRPKKENPNRIPNNNPKANPNHNHHNDLDNDLDLEERLKGSFDEIFLDNLKVGGAYPGIDIDLQLRQFCLKVRGSPGHYLDHEINGLRLAFQRQLREARPTSKQESPGERTGADIKRKLGIA